MANNIKGLRNINTTPECGKTIVINTTPECGKTKKVAKLSRDEHGTWRCSVLMPGGNIWSQNFETFEQAAEVLFRAEQSDKVIGCVGQIRYVGQARTIICAESPIRKDGKRKVKSLTKDQRRTLMAEDSLYVEHISTGEQVTRLTLHPDYDGSYGAKEWKIDTVRKALSALEEEAIKLGGKDAYIRVVSTIPEIDSWRPQDRDKAQAKQDLWQTVCVHGITLNGKTYVPFGAPVNGLKDNKTIWVLKDIRDELREIMKRGSLDSWLTTEAKKIAYLYGLQATAPSWWVDLPLRPEDCYFKSGEPIVDIKDMVAYGHKNNDVTLNESDISAHQGDGPTFFSVSPLMREVFAERLIEEGRYDNMDDALNHVDRELDKMPGIFSGRTRNGAIKPAMYNVPGSVQKYWHAHGVHDRDGRDVDRLVVIGNTTARKTPIGPKGCAYETEDAWANGIRDGFQLGVMIPEHEDKLTKSSYQLLQLLYGASDENLMKLAQHEAKYINSLVIGKGRYRLMGREKAIVSAFEGSFLSHPMMKSEMTETYHRIIEQAFEGMIHNHIHNAMLFPDPVAYIQWLGDLPVTGCIEANTIVCPAAKMSGKGIMYRNPLTNLGAVREVEIINKWPEEYADLFPAKTNAVFHSWKDANVTRMEADADGDHVSYSFLKPLVDCVRECHEKYGDIAIDFDRDEVSDKHVVTEKSLTAYFMTRVRKNKLGEKCYNLNKLYAMTADNEWFANHPYVQLPEWAEEEVDLATEVRNVRDVQNAVDSGKHETAEVNDNKQDAWLRGMKQSDAVILRQARDLRDSDGNKVNDIDDLIALIKQLKYDGNGAIDRYMRMLRGMVSIDLPAEWFEGEFESSCIFFNTEDCGSRTGIRGLWREGDYDKDLKFAPNEGLFNGISRRYRDEWKQLVAGEDNAMKRMSKHDFDELCKKQALDEIEELVNTFGCSLKEAHDVVARRILELRPDPKTKANTTNEGRARWNRTLWDSFWNIFGEMTIEAVKQNRYIENFNMKEVLNLTIDELLDIDMDDIECNIDD